MNVREGVVDDDTQTELATAGYELRLNHTRDSVIHPTNGKQLHPRVAFGKLTLGRS
jgi:hypothetical protein